jgi:hypothetical protein
MVLIKLSPFTLRYRARLDEELGGGGGGQITTGAPFVGGAGSGAESAPKKGAARSAAKGGGRKRSAKGGAKKSAAGAKQSASKQSGAKQSAGGARKKGGDVPPQLSLIDKAAPELVGPLAALNPNLAHTLLDSSLSQVEVGEDWARAAAEKLRPVVEDLRRGTETVTVALWDMDARVGLLPSLIEALNEAQEVFTFFDLQAPVPAGLVVRAEYFDDWVKHRTKQAPDDFTAWVRDSAEKERVGARQFKDNLISNDFYKYARGIHRQLGVDYLAGITQYKVAGYEGGDYFWDYFSASQKGLLLTSAHGLREYARAADRPFEAAVGQVVVAQLLVEIGPRARFHEDFDFNDDRAAIVNSIREMRIEPECLGKIDERYRAAAEGLARALRDYARPREFVLAAQAEQAEQSAAPKHDDKYWLKQLNLLSAKVGKEQKR